VERNARRPSWLSSPDVQIPAALALAVALALGEWQVVRALRKAGTGTNAADVVRPPTRAPAAAPSQPTSGPLDDRVVEGLVRRLSQVPRGSPAWVAATADDADAIRRAQQIQAILTRAGWEVRPLVRTPQRTRPGYFLFAADEEPPAYVSALAAALEQEGINRTFALGYRAYYEEMSRTRPGFVGFRFEPGQTFLLVVGRAS
jgi:hypothetical protein